MADKYYPEKLKFLTESLKQLFVILISVIAGIIYLLRQENLTAMDRVLLLLGVAFVLFLIIIIFIVGFRAFDTLDKIKSNDGF